PVIQPLQLLLMIFAGWLNRRQIDLIEYLKEENRILEERLGGRRIRLTDADECANRMIFFGTTSLQHALAQFMAHYHRERNHQGVGNHLLQYSAAAHLLDTPVK